VQLRAEGAVVAVGQIAEHRRRWDLPASRLLAQARRQRGLRLEPHRVGDLRLAPPLAIPAPLLGQIQRPAQRQRAPLADRVYRDRNLAVADLAERARVLALHPRRVLAVLDDPGVVDHPGRHADLGRHPLRARAHDQTRIPGRVGQKLLHRLIPGRRLLEPKQRRLQTLTAPVLDQAPHIQERILTLPPKRQPPSDLLHEATKPIANVDRRHLECKHRPHLLLLKR